jgi:L,D-peptidoglycan transpeptidase YkuD (ErfK/YbiS/YcfS/YnhG family)
MKRRTALALLTTAAVSVTAAPAVPAGCTQLLRVETAAWSAASGVLTLWVRDHAKAPWRQDGPAIPVVIGRNGLRWGRGRHRSPRGAPAKREGDGCAPAGLFALDVAFGDAPAAKSGVPRWPYVPMTPSHAGVDDPRSRHYNRVVDAAAVTKDWTSAENMRPRSGVYRRGLVVRHNWDQRPHAGSCIFLHIWDGPRSTTAGCTAMTARNMQRVLSWLDAARQPLLVQLPAAEMAAHRAAWGLP